MKMTLKECTNRCMVIHDTLGVCMVRIAQDNGDTFLHEFGALYPKPFDPDTEVTLLTDHAATWRAACEAVKEHIDDCCGGWLRGIDADRLSAIISTIASNPQPPKEQGSVASEIVRGLKQLREEQA